MKQAQYFQFDTSYFSLPDHLYTRLAPSPVAMPTLVVLNNALLAAMGLDLPTMDHHACAELFSGNDLPNNATPFCQAYAGHQFGHFTFLGDGRAHIVGEHVCPDGKRVDIAFKGSGRTPYSRRGDGRATLGPMLREYIISEAMHALGIPTTRSLAVVMTGETVVRETDLPGAILTRVASSHIRVGTFEYLANQHPDDVGALCDYAIKRHYPEIAIGNRPLEFLKAVMARQIDLMVDWMRVGFIHGVMNTDNMLISGETIDYGPCAFMDQYAANTVFSSIDHAGRYAYANQPGIAQWNLCRLAEALLPIIHKDRVTATQLASDVINTFPRLYQMKWLAMMRAKLGLTDAMAGDDALVFALLEWMEATKADYTGIFFDLSYRDNPATALTQDTVFMAWYQQWRNRLRLNEQTFEQSQLDMRKYNPAVIPRNHQVEKALEAALGDDFTVFNHLMTVLSTPYIHSETLYPYQQPPLPSERVYQTYCGT